MDLEVFEIVDIRRLLEKYHIDRRCLKLNGIEESDDIEGVSTISGELFQRECSKFEPSSTDLGKLGCYEAAVACTLPALDYPAIATLLPSVDNKSLSNFSGGIDDPKEEFKELSEDMSQNDIIFSSSQHFQDTLSTTQIEPAFASSLAHVNKKIKLQDYDILKSEESAFDFISSDLHLLEPSSELHLDF